MTAVLPNDEEIKNALMRRTTPELRAFQKKLKQIDTPQAWAIRLHLIRELGIRGDDVNGSEQT